MKDSKQVVREDRERLDLEVRAVAVAVCVAEIDAETIDRINIYQATRMRCCWRCKGWRLRRTIC